MYVWHVVYFYEVFLVISYFISVSQNFLNHINSLSLDSYTLS